MGRYLRSGSLCSVSASPPSEPRRCQTRVPQRETPSRWSRLSVRRQQSEHRTQPNTHYQVCVCVYTVHKVRTSWLVLSSKSCLRELEKVLTKGRSGRMCVADRFELDSLSDLVQKCVPAGAGHRPLLLLHLLQLGPLSDLA